MAPTFVFLVAGITVPGFVMADSFVPVVGFRGHQVEVSGRPERVAGLDRRCSDVLVIVPHFVLEI